MEDPAEETLTARILHMFTTSGAGLQPVPVFSSREIQLVPANKSAKLEWIKSSSARKDPCSKLLVEAQLRPAMELRVAISFR